MEPTTRRKRSLPTALVVTFIMLSAICHQQAISISDQQQKLQVSAKTTSTPTTSETLQLSSTLLSTSTTPPSPLATQMIGGIKTAPQATTTTTEQSTSGSASASTPTSTSTPATTATNGRSSRSPQNQQQQQQTTTTGVKQHGGRVRKPTTRQQQQQQRQSAIASSTVTTSPTTGTSGDQALVQDPLQDEIKRMMDYGNTPPLFVTTTRDFFVDVARYPLGFKLTTIQAVDVEGDQLEYSLQPAAYRDASPYFSINSTSGELRLANKRIPLTGVEPDATSGSRSKTAPKGDMTQTDKEEDEDEEDEEGTSKLQGSTSSLQQQQDTLLEKPGYLYFLNVAANDGKYTSVVELQIHVFNSTSFGTKSPVQLTIEGGHRGSESLMRAKTNEFFERLYQRPAQAPDSSNSTIVFPSFVNPALIMPNQNQLEDADLSGSMIPTTDSPRPRLSLQGEDHKRSYPHHASDDQVRSTHSNGPLDNHLAGAQPMTGRHSNQLASSSIISEAAAVTPPAHDKQHVEQLMHQPVMLSLIIIICSCLIIAFVLLVFIVPLSVKRLKERLKNMELQHEQLSQKASNGGSSIVGGCSTSSGGSLSASMITSGHLPSLSQLTLASSNRSCAIMQMPVTQHHHYPDLNNHNHNQHNNHHLHHHHHHEQQHLHQRVPLGRQSSLDSAITNGTSNFAPSYLHNQHHQTFRLMSSPAGSVSTSQKPTNSNNRNSNHNNMITNQQITNNGLNLMSNGAIVNPAYLHQQQLHCGGGNASSKAIEDNIYCPIDDEFYSTINTESTMVDVNYNQHQHQPTFQTGLHQGQHLTGQAATLMPPMVNNNQVGSLVGQTCDSRNYFASGCAPQTHQPMTSSTTSSQHDRQEQRDTDSPTQSISSRSSTRSLARFLSLPARHWSHQTQEQCSGEAGDGDAVECSKRKGSLLDELEQHFSSSATTTTRPVKPPRTHGSLSQCAAKTIARANRISQEQQVRHKRQKNDETRQQQQHPQDQWEIERHKLKFLDILDEGQFGLVWRCKLRAKDGEKDETTVAVKTLKSFALKEARERDELLAEIEIMKLVCEHPNVVRMLHCCTQDINQSRPILLVMEHVQLGKLQSFLEKSRSSHQYATSASLYNHAASRNYLLQQQDYRASSVLGGEGGADDDQSERLSVISSSSSSSGRPPPRGPNQACPEDYLTSRDLIKFIYHTAQGMEYISSKCIVHRDLASRNILVSSQRVCKIGDFGMARHMASVGDVYERHSRNTKVPVRWMAPEVLLENSFTTKSDVFSFGILMWEIVTLGSTPYRHLKTDQIIEAVARSGERPERPQYCHELLYSIMSRCWSHEPQARPSFRELVEQLDTLLLSTEEYIELDQYPDRNYYNIPKTAAPLELL